MCFALLAVPVQAAYGQDGVSVVRRIGSPPPPDLHALDTDHDLPPLKFDFHTYDEQEQRLWMNIAQMVCQANAEDPCANFPSQVNMPPFRGEFGEENLFSIPIAYFLSTCGKLASTIGCGNMSAYYWFSKNHTDNMTCRRNPGQETVRLPTTQDPNKQIVCFNDILSGRIPPAWRPVPYLQHYWSMPILNSPKDFMNAPFQLVVLNKYNGEWGSRPINFIDHPTVSKVIELFQSTCGNDARILYSRMNNVSADHLNGEMDQRNDYELMDGAGHTDWDLIRSSGRQVETIQAVQAAHPDLSSNELKLRVMTRTKCFLSVQGGTGVPAFFFGGKHIVLHNQGREGGIFYGHSAKKFSGQDVTVVSHNNERLLQVFQEKMLADGCAACSMRKAVNEGVNMP